MSRNPSIVFDLDYLLAIEDDETRPVELFQLSAVSVSVLTQLAEMLMWRNTRWIGDDEAEIVRLSGLIYEELKVPLHLSDLIQYIDDIETLLRELKAVSCCPGDTVTYLPIVPPDDPGYDWDGTEYPTTYGEEETVDDFDDYRELLCGFAHAYIDELKRKGDELVALVGGGVLVVGAIAALLALLATGGILIPVAYTLAAAITTAIVTGGTTAIFGDVSDDIETDRDNLVCAFLTFDPETFKTELEDAIGEAPYDLFFKWLDFTTIMRVAQTGEYEGDYAGIVRSTDCGTCGLQLDYDIQPDFTSDLDSLTGQLVVWDATGGGSARIEGSGATNFIQIREQDVISKTDVINGDVVTSLVLSGEYMITATTACELRVVIYSDASYIWTTIRWDDAATSAWHEFNIDLSTLGTTTINNTSATYVTFAFDMDGSYPGPPYCYLRNLRVGGTIA